MTGALPGLTVLQRLLDSPLLVVADDAVPRLPSPVRRPTRGGDGDPEQARLAALVTLAQGGDGEAFAQLYDQYVPMIYRYLYYRTGSQALAEDLTSETFLRALRRITTFAWQGENFGAWLIVIARNLCVDHFRSAAFRLELPTGEILDTDRPDDGIEDLVLGRLRSAALVDALRRLQPDHQECLVLRFLQGLSVSETARVLDRSEGAVKQLQFRAVRALGRLLPEEVA